ncbi:MAG: radical SAM family heme chaperone HemW [Hyphomonadaceae bacterium]|nr:radical SAM family heme chaperone HemW [Hyphomonadaceae bacterium]
MTGFGVYIHWPYCAKLCPYCDFNVYRARDLDRSPLRAAIVADIRGHAALYGRRPVDTIFLGGGTPSLMTGSDIAVLIEAVDAAYGLSPAAEITLEANPEDAGRFAAHAAAGVNRFSVGVQALRDDALRALGRAHDAAAARRAVDAAAATGRRVSIDLIYAREGQGLADWTQELRAALALPAEHLSLYQLTIEAGTAFERAVARGRLSPPEDELAAALYEATQALCVAHGAPAYEISNHARGPAARARHNLLYWRGGDWIGVGPGAHGRLTHDGARLATRAHDRPEAYRAAVDAHGVGAAAVETLTRAAHAEEAVLMGLRVAEGLPRAAVEDLRGRPLDAGAVADFRAAGLLDDACDVVRLTPAGRLLADHIARRLAQ